MILELLRRRDVRGGVGRIFEFHGDGVATLSVSERGTIANMIVELGATTAVFPSDARTRDWLEAQRRGGDFVALAADPGARYDEEELVDLAALEPLVALPSSPGNVVPVREAEGTEIVQVCVGSSVNSAYADLAIVGAVLDGAAVHPSIDLTVTPGSRQILETILRSGVYGQLVGAGARMLEPICGPCIGVGQAPSARRAALRTFNRNFPGRSGTEDDRDPPVLAGDRGRERADRAHHGPAVARRAAGDPAAAGRAPDRRPRGARPGAGRARPRRSRSYAGPASSRRRARSRPPTRSPARC